MDIKKNHQLVGLLLNQHTPPHRRGMLNCVSEKNFLTERFIKLPPCRITKNFAMYQGTLISLAKCSHAQPLILPGDSAGKEGRTDTHLNTGDIRNGLAQPNYSTAESCS